MAVLGMCPVRTCIEPLVSLPTQGSVWRCVQGVALILFGRCAPTFWFHSCYSSLPKGLHALSLERSVQLLQPTPEPFGLRVIFRAPAVCLEIHRLGAACRRRTALEVFRVRALGGFSVEPISD